MDDTYTQVMDMFRSSSFHTIDPKGRIIIPARFRKILKDHGENGVMVTNMGSGLNAYRLSEWEKVEQRILAAKSKNMVDFKRYFLGNACLCTLDKQDRILLPQNLRESASLEKDIVLVGVLDHFEIWSRENWDLKNAKMVRNLENEEVREEIASLGL